MLRVSFGVALRASLLFIVFGLVSAQASELLPSPSGTPILQISGQVENTNRSGSAAFDMAMLRNVGVSRLRTSTPWTQGRPEFEGVLVSDLLKAVGAKGRKVIAVALNDYRVEIPLTDFTRYPVLLAYQMDGKRLKIRDKGPLWIIYPRDDYAELDSKPIQARWVWQVKELRIQ